VTRILFVESYPHVLFGQQRTMLSLLGACSDMGVEPLVAVTAEGPFTDEVRQRGIELVEFPYPDSISGYGGAIYRTRGLRWLRMMGQVAGYILGIRRELPRLQVGAVFCNDMRGLLTVGVAACSLGLPVMIWDKLDKPHGWMDWVQLPLVRRNLIISDAVRSKYPRWQQSLYRGKVAKVYNGADLARFADAVSFRESLPCEPDDVLVAIVGTITERKGQDRILRVWDELVARCPRMRLLVVGETSGSAEDEAYLAALPNRDHPRVHFLGMRRDVPAIMKSTDMLLVPSRHEGMGQVTVEAMACAVPVIGANTGGIPEVVVDGETGIIIDGDSPQEMTEAVLRLAESPELRARMGAAGRERVEAHFNRPVQMRKVLEQLVAMA
jgi:glycosyltransferase involved in cell wall biosynthesis